MLYFVKNPAGIILTFFALVLMFPGAGLALSPAGASALISAARDQVGVTVEYDPAYVKLAYPGGDVPPEKGVCTDVIIRAMRRAFNFDLQKMVHEDMRKNFSIYPKKWGLKKPDRNIDHRRVPNLQKYLSRHATQIEISSTTDSFLPGDIVTCTLPGNLPHIMLVSDKKTASGTPLVIHNIGQGTREEDCLFMFPLTGHFRLK